MTRRSIRQRGYALLIVLWSLAMLALLGTQVLATARQETQLARNLRDAAVLEAAANGAVQDAIFATLDTSGHHWDPDGIARMIQVGHVPVTVRIDDESEKLNPNFSSTALLQALLTQLGTDPGTAAAVASAIAEWRDARSVPGHPGAAIARYAAAGRDYAPTGAPFASVDELGAVLNMTPVLLARLRPHLTVFTDGDPGAASSDPVIARALAAVGQTGGAGEAGNTSLVSITAEARGPGRARFAIRVVVQTNAPAGGRVYQVLDYQRAWDGLP
jgi:general secretion pathway protein K